MTNHTIVIKCTLANKDGKEGIELMANNIWKSPGEGWLTFQHGKWIQNSFSGMILMNEDGVNILTLTGLIFDAAVEGASGELRYDIGGDVGWWKVVTTV